MMLPMKKHRVQMGIGQHTKRAHNALFRKEMEVYA